MKHVFGSPRRMLVAGAATVGAIALLAGCAGGSTPEAEVPTNEVAELSVPDYYPADYQSIIDAAKEEGGTLLVYSSTDQENWDPVFRDFRKKYPFVTDVQALNLDSDEVFQRQISEAATGNSPADILASNSVQAWTTYVDRDNALLDYESPELGEVPDFANPLPNVYAMAANAQAIGVNTALVAEAPTSFADLAAQLESGTAGPENLVGIRDISSSFAFTVYYNLLESRPELWDAFSVFLGNSRPESSSGALNEKVLAGEYKAAITTDSGTALNLANSSDGLFDLVYPTDGALILTRNIGITGTTSHPNTAKLFVDFVLSAEGQRAVLEGGLGSFRDDLDFEVPGSVTYADVVETVGEDNILTARYEKVDDADVAEFTQRWDSLRG